MFNIMSLGKKSVHGVVERVLDEAYLIIDIGCMDRTNQLVFNRECDC